MIDDKLILERAKKIIEKQRASAINLNAKLTKEQRGKMAKKAWRTKRKIKKLKALYAMSTN